MADTHIPDLVSAWVPMTNTLDLKHLGKFGEELGECSASVSRCIIQGIDACEPVTLKVNREWLEEEIADVIANALLVAEHFNLDAVRIDQRMDRKVEGLRRWHAMLEGM